MVQFQHKHVWARVAQKTCQLQVAVDGDAAKIQRFAVRTNKGSHTKAASAARAGFTRATGRLKHVRHVVQMCARGDRHNRIVIVVGVCNWRKVARVHDWRKEIAAEHKRTKVYGHVHIYCGHARPKHVLLQRAWQHASALKAVVPIPRQQQWRQRLAKQSGFLVKRRERNVSSHAVCQWFKLTPGARGLFALRGCCECNAFVVRLQLCHARNHQVLHCLNVHFNVLNANAGVRKQTQCVGVHRAAKLSTVLGIIKPPQSRNVHHVHTKIAVTQLICAVRRTFTNRVKVRQCSVQRGFVTERVKHNQRFFSIIVHQMNCAIGTFKRKSFTKSRGEHAKHRALP